MSASLDLTPEEREIAEHYVETIERSAKQWPRMRWLCVGLLAWMFGFSLFCMQMSWTGLMSPFSVTDRLESPEMPEDAPPTLFLVAEFNRSVALLETSNRAQVLYMIEGVIGILFAFAGVLLVVMMVGHWRDGPKKALLAKLLRTELSAQVDGSH
jgi:hypothetical protein